MGAKNGTNGRRLGERTPTHSRARVYDSVGRSVEVAIKDISQTGARLQATEETSIPRQFMIRFGQYEARGEVVWRKGIDVGIRFVLPNEEEGRVRPREPELAKKPTIDELRTAAKPRRGMLRFLLG
ncbi:MAG TPA: PilZ domain-containing protein [Beijerinckiaceae bacterium]|nr:PilZ domain-containing protein [Methylobacteriaceae bacterium]MCC2109002.1 PilZ domain-containing protein [Hyphomicrobiales bacterium]MCO5088864.1 PilZ domain-containing protein [Methylobacteriaceae bacterium]HRY04190.1 PilZ domain-containing protein [Beijerinckiaceae bacterium]